MLLVPCSLSVNAVKVGQGNLKVIVLQLLWFLCSSKVADGSKCLYIWFSVAVLRADPTSDFTLLTPAVWWNCVSSKSWWEGRAGAACVGLYKSPEKCIFVFTVEFNCAWKQSNEFKSNIFGAHLLIAGIYAVFIMIDSVMPKHSCMIFFLIMVESLERHIIFCSSKHHIRYLIYIVLYFLIVDKAHTKTLICLSLLPDFTSAFLWLLLKMQILENMLFLPGKEVNTPGKIMSYSVKETLRWGSYRTGVLLCLWLVQLRFTCWKQPHNTRHANHALIMFLRIRVFKQNDCVLQKYLSSMQMTSYFQHVCGYWVVDHCHALTFLSYLVTRAIVEAEGRWLHHHHHKHRRKHKQAKLTNHSPDV